MYSSVGNFLVESTILFPINVPGKVCFLCDTNAPYMTKFSNWKEREKRFVVRYCNKSIPQDADIC